MNEPTEGKVIIEDAYGRSAEGSPYESLATIMDRMQQPPFDPEPMRRAVIALAHIGHGPRLINGCSICANAGQCDSVDYAGPANFGEEPSELRCELRAGHPGPHRVEWS